MFLIPELRTTIHCTEASNVLHKDNQGMTWSKFHSPHKGGMKCKKEEKLTHLTNWEFILM